MRTTNRALYDSSIIEFLNTDTHRIYGLLCENYHGDALTTSREAWLEEIRILKDVLSPLSEQTGHIIFEYEIPRLGKRIDVVLLIDGVVICLEFKVGQSSRSQNDIDQVLAWTHKRLSDYLRRGGTYGNKLKVPNFPMSEAAFLIWSLDQREDWATIVCLVGGGQEINTGEAGISEWIKALNHHFSHWKIYISNQLVEPEYAEGKVNELLKNNKNVTFKPDLHLSVSLRSFRAEKLSAFIHSMLSINQNAANLYDEIKDRYPIVITRSMDKARKWLRKQTRGSQRSGVLVSKVAARFKPLAVHLLPQDDDNAVHWFLDDKTDVRSSNFLEDAATEIQVQGLELDYACVLWDADMRFDNGKWRFYTFNGKTSWNEQLPTTENKNDLIKYMLNAYRVLLTRARLGMVICIPEGNPNKSIEGFWEDRTRMPEYYDGTYNYLKSLGLKEHDLN